MSFETERQAIQGRFYTQWGNRTQVAYDNERFDFPSQDAWVRLTILNGTGLRRNIGDNAQIYRYPGIIEVQIFIPIGEGTDEIRLHADEVVNIFRNARFSGIVCDTSSVTRVGPAQGGSWFQVNVSTPFRRDEIVNQ